MSDNHSSNSGPDRVTDHGHFSALLHSIFWFPIAALIPLVQMKYQSRDPFKEHYGILLTVIVAILGYAVTGAFVIIKLLSQDSSYYKLISKVCLLSGALATVSLVFILIPLLGGVLFLLWAFCFAWVVYVSYEDFNPLLNHAKLRVFHIWKKLITAEEGPNPSPPNRLPV